MELRICIDVDDMAHAIRFYTGGLGLLEFKAGVTTNGCSARPEPAAQKERARQCGLLGASGRQR